MSYDSALIRLDEAASTLAQAARMRLGTNVNPRPLAERADAALRAALRELPGGGREVEFIQQARSYLRPYAGLGCLGCGALGCLGCGVLGCLGCGSLGCLGCGVGQLPGPLGPAFGVPKMPSGPTTARMPQGVTLPGITMQTRTIGPQFSAARQLIVAARQLVVAKVRQRSARDRPGLGSTAASPVVPVVALLVVAAIAGALLYAEAKT